MSTVVLAPRVLPREARRVALLSPNYSPNVVIAVFGAGAIAAGLIALASAARPGFSAFMASSAVFLVVVAFVAVRWTGSLAADRVEVDQAADGLRFVASRGTRALFSVLAVVGLFPGIVAGGFTAAGMPASVTAGIDRFGPYVVSLIALVFLGQQLLTLRTAPGLSLSATGLSGVRGTTRVRLDWDELASATAVFDRGAKLVLTRVGGSPYILEPRWTGSDPNIVAAIIEHFRLHPSDRVLLSDPQAAIRRVEEAAAAR